MSQKKWIAYVGPFPFPWGQAASRRMFGIAQSFAACGYDVVVGTGDAEPKEPELVWECEAGSVSRIGLAELPGPGAGDLEKATRAFVSWGARTVRWLESMPSPAFVLGYGGGAPFAGRLLRWGRHRNVPVAFDVVEWYESSHFPGGSLNPFSISSEICMRWLYPRAEGVIAISSYLEDFYAKSVATVVRIPPTLDVRSLPESKSRSGSEPGLPYRLVYAGTPGKKDALPLILAAVAAVDPEGTRIAMTVIGVEEKDVAAYSPPPKLSRGVRFLGRIPQSEVAGHVGASDFSVLLREPMRFANAGFPTKFVESLSVGTPVISNLTSDIGRYLVDGVSGVVVEGCSADALVRALERVVRLAPDELARMRTNARRVAMESFDFRAYCEDLTRFARRVERLSQLGSTV
jgi:glycosyltransferase involved in cell wall biosynthesis